MARILLLGKHPPLVGGVTTSTLSAIASLAQFGHVVDVVTLGPELGPSTSSWPTWNQEYPNPLEGQSVAVYRTHSLAQDSYIPWSDPLLTKLIGEALRVADQARPDIIVGWYLEPFGMAAALLGQLLQLPVILRHAGSDIGRLANHPQLRRAYRAAAARATSIITSPRSKDVLIERLGANVDTLVMHGGEPLPPWFDAPAARDIPRVDASDWLRLLDIDQRAVDALTNSRAVTASRSVPRILNYGKVGTTKGTWELLEALNRLASRNCDFVFITVPSGHRRAVVRYLNDLARLPSLLERTVVLPPAPNWVIATLLKHVDAACCLENEFPIAFHTPTVPREILASRVQLIVSGEIHAKQLHTDSLVDDVNVHVVANPRDVTSLASVVERALYGPARVQIAERGWLLARTWERQIAKNGSILLKTVNAALEAQ